MLNADFTLVATGPFPSVVGVRPPRLAWRIGEGSSLGGTSDYEVEIASGADFSDSEIVWRSGRVRSTKMAVECDSAQFGAHRPYWWRVRAWSGEAASAWTAPRRFETAKRAAGDWVAEMIMPDADPGAEQRCPTVCGTFMLDAVPPDVRLYVSAHGLYQASLNGAAVGDDQLAPGWTSYNERLGYQTHDVSHLLRVGENRLDFVLADGWYRGALIWEQGRVTCAYGTRLGVIAELRTLGADKPILVTDGRWRSGLSNVMFASLYHGESVDGRLPRLGPPTGGVSTKDFERRTLVAQEAEAVRIIGTLAPVEERTGSLPGVTFYDFGQNIAGVVALRVEGAAGARVIVEHAEILHADGELNRSSHNDARSRLEYVLAGSGEEQYRPSFTFMGFRHVKVTVEGEARVLGIEAHPLSSALEQTGQMSTGHALVNRLIANADWSLKGNFIDVPTDCPQRSERLGWCGDAQIFSPTASYVRDCRQFFRKWLRDMMADQREDGAISHVVPHPARYRQDRLPNFYGSAGWGDAICMVPWTLYLHYGDADVLVETLPAMRRWVDFLLSLAPEGIVCPPNDIRDKGFTFGDWLSPTTFQGRWLPPNAKPNPITGDDYVATCFLFGSATVLAKAAAVVGEAGIAERYRAVADRVRMAFQREFLTTTGRIVYDSQGALLLALHHGLLPDGAVPAAIERLRKAIDRTEGHIGTGVMTTSLVLPTLSRFGLQDVAIDMLLKTTSPSWLYQVTRGATTVWERWDGIDLEGSPLNKMNSYNHYAYGAVVFWFYHHLAGIQPVEAAPGFAEIVFSPEFHRALGPVTAEFRSPRGPVHARWTFEGDDVTYAFECPAGARPTLRLDMPTISSSLDGDPVEPRMLAQGIAVTPGKHALRVTLPAAAG